MYIDILEMTLCTRFLLEVLWKPVFLQTTLAKWRKFNQFLWQKFGIYQEKPFYPSFYAKFSDFHQKNSPFIKIWLLSEKCLFVGKRLFNAKNVFLSKKFNGISPSYPKNSPFIRKKIIQPDFEKYFSLH